MTGDDALGRRAGAAQDPLPPVTTRPSAPDDAGVGAGEPAPPFFPADGAPGVDSAVQATAATAGGAGEAAPAATATPLADEAEDDVLLLEDVVEEGTRPDSDPVLIGPAAEETPPVAETPAGQQPTGAVADLATRLEQVARRLRTEGYAAVSSGLAAGDRFDAALAGLLAGYMAARDDG